MRSAELNLCLFGRVGRKRWFPSLVQFLKLDRQPFDEFNIVDEVDGWDRERLFEMPPRRNGIPSASFDPGQ